MKKRRMLSSEAAYFIGIIVLALGTAFMERADFGMSMVVAPAYLFYLKLSQTYAWFTFGMAEYCFQAVLLVIIALIMRRFKTMYLFSFVTAFLYGIILDLMMGAVGRIILEGIAGRIIFFLGGLVLCSFGVALLFHTYIAPEAYELMVKEISAKTGTDITRVKTVYDCCSCALAVILSFLFFGFGHFEGVKAGTIFCALINGWTIGQCGRLLEHLFDFRDAWGLRKYFA
ncbi:MAG: DUF6198 family protein [Erysipelotrichaceae bacterium]|nr:DUF6198 family protein [Erysipelotrichaceae bacterium]